MKLPAFWSAIFFITGILIGRSLHIPDMIVLLTAGAVFAGGLIIYLKDLARYSWIIAVCALFAGGLFRISLDTSELPGNHISHFNDLGTPVILKGEIISEPDLRPLRTYLTLRADTLIYGGSKINVSGLVILRLKYTATQYNYADYIEARGFLDTPRGARNPGMFDYGKYLANKKIRSIIYINNRHAISEISRHDGNLLLTGLIIPLRKYMLDVFNKYLDDPQRHLIAGFLIGQTRFIPEDIYQQFRDTGTLHLLAVSGSNVALVIATLELILLILRVPVRIRHVISLLGIIVFCLLSYSQPSVVRASVMISLYLLGRLAFRQVNYINIISMAAILILCFDPLMLWDVGFQLSFAATFGLVYILPLIYRRLKGTIFLRNKILSFILMVFLSSIVAQVSVVPILAANFHTIPIIGFASNIVIVPLASLSVIISLLLVILGWFAPAASLLAGAADFILSFTVHAVRFFADLPVAKIEIFSPGWILIGLYYLTVILLCKLIIDLRILKYLVITVLILLNIMIWPGIINGFKSEPCLDILDCGKYFAVRLKTSDGGQYLITNIDRTTEYDPYENMVEPYLRQEGVMRPVYRLDSLGCRPWDLSENPDMDFPSETESRIPTDNPSEQILMIKSEKLGLTEGIIYRWESFSGLVLFNTDAVLDFYSNDPQCFENIDLLVMPRPENCFTEICTVLNRLKPEYVVFSSYDKFFVDTERFLNKARECLKSEIDFVCTRESGVIKIRPASYKMTLKSTDFPIQINSD